MPPSRTAPRPSTAAASWLHGTTAVIAALVLVKLLVHLLTNQQYGYHRDELLYLAMGKRLAWGYLEVPPSIGALAAVVRATLGEALWAVRLPSALASAAVVGLTGLMTRAFGGGRLTILIAGLCVLIAPVFLRTGTLFQPVPFDQLYWLLGAYLLVRWIQTGDDRWWLAVGGVIGLGLLNKYTMLLFGAGVLVGLLLTPRRRVLATPWPWLAAGITLAIALPNLLWQAQHDWPLFWHLGELTETQLAGFSRLGFITDQILIHHPITLPVWLLGLVFFFSKRGRPFRLLGWIYATAFVVLLVFQGKAYYLTPAVPMLFAGGAVVLVRWTARRRYRRAWQGLLIAVLLLTGLAMAPIGLPMLPPAQMARFMGLMRLAQTVETQELADLPQDYADMFGWPEKAAAVAAVYHRLPPEEQAPAVILAGNYGQAGALDLFGPALGLPEPVSAASSFYLWGPGPKPGTVAVALGIPQSFLEHEYAVVEQAAVATHPYALPVERDVPVYVCRDPRRTLQQIWPELHPAR